MFVASIIEKSISKSSFLMNLKNQKNSSQNFSKGNKKLKIENVK